MYLTAVPLARPKDGPQVEARLQRPGALPSSSAAEQLPKAHVIGIFHKLEGYHMWDILN